MRSPDQAIQTWRDQPPHARLLGQDALGQECIVQTVDGIPPVLYRYLDKPEFAADAIRNGRLRLGTLYGYLKSEGHNSAQHDLNEGLVSTLDLDFHGAVDAPISMIATSTDRWITCLTEELSKERMEEFGSKAVLEVQTTVFVKAVAVAMARHSPIGSLDRVRYVPDNMGSLRNVSDKERMAHTYKTSNYAQQREWRLCFEARNAHQESIHYRKSFERFGNRAAMNTREFWENARTNGASGRLLEPCFIQSPDIAIAVRDVTHQLTK